MRVRLWTWWQGPRGSVPPGTEVEVDPATARQIVQAGGGESLPAPEVAMLATPETAVRRRTPKGRRRA